MADSPGTEAGRAMDAWWMAGRTHPPTIARHQEFIDQIRTVEREARAAALAAVRERVWADLSPHFPAAANRVAAILDDLSGDRT